MRTSNIYGNQSGEESKQQCHAIGDGYEVYTDKWGRHSHHVATIPGVKDDGAACLSAAKVHAEPA